MHHLVFGASTAGHALSPVYMKINALSAGKRHYEKCVNMCEDGSNKLLITISGSVQRVSVQSKILALWSHSEDAV